MRQRLPPLTRKRAVIRRGGDVTLVYLAIAWAAGLLLAHFCWWQGVLGCATPGWPWAAAAAACLGGAAALRRHPLRRLAAILTLFLVLGAWRYQTQPFAACPDPAQLSFYNGDQTRPVYATVEGVVVGYPDVRDVRMQYRLRAASVTVAEQAHPVRGDVLVQAPRFPEYRYGDRLQVTGQLVTPPVSADFDYRRYLAGRGIHSLLRRGRIDRVAESQGNLLLALLYALKTLSADLLNRTLPEPAAALANGMLLGIESGIPDDVSEAFTATGTSHVIVISGSNIALLSGVLMAGLSRVLGKRRAVWPAIVLIAAYVLLVGADAAALRAGLMGILYVFAIYLGRQSTAHVSLCASGLVMTAVNPLTLWDVGFQLSFLATLGLILFNRPIAARFERVLARRLQGPSGRWVLGLLNDGLIVTLSAQVLTLPLIIYDFGRLSLISLVTNFLILPAQPPIMTWGMATLVAGLAWEPLGRVLAGIPWLFLTYTTSIVRLTAAVPLASVETGPAGRILALAYYAALVGTMLWRVIHPRGWIARPDGRAAIWAVVIVAPAWLTITLLAARPDGRLHLWFIPAETGEAVLIVTPTGRRAWVWDGRGDGAVLAEASRKLFGNQLAVDATIGPAVTDLWPGAQTVDPARFSPGTLIRLDRDLSLALLDANGAWALYLSYDRFRTLLPTTLRAEAQAALLRDPDSRLSLVALKAPGPGAGAWPDPDLLAATMPQVIIWPDETTYPPGVDALLKAQNPVRVPNDMAVEVITDGKRLWSVLHSGTGER